MPEILLFCDYRISADGGAGQLAAGGNDGLAVGGGVPAAQRGEPGGEMDIFLHGHRPEVVGCHGHRGRDGLPGKAVNGHAHDQVHHGIEHTAMERSQTVDLPGLERKAQGDFPGLVIAGDQLRIQLPVEGVSHICVDEPKLLLQPVTGRQHCSFHCDSSFI